MEITHWGFDPGHSGLAQHSGERDACSAPECQREEFVSHPINELVRLLAESMNLPGERDIAMLVHVARQRFEHSTWAVQGHVFLNGTRYCECGKYVGPMAGWSEHTAELRAQGLPTALPEVPQLEREAIEARLGIPTTRCVDCGHLASLHAATCFSIGLDDEGNDSYCLCDSKDFKVGVQRVGSVPGE